MQYSYLYSSILKNEDTFNKYLQEVLMQYSYLYSSILKNEDTFNKYLQVLYK